MKIECDKCGAKYSIADEKVRGKTFKIRCKKCSNVIIVRDKGAAAAAAGGGAAAAAAEAPASAEQQAAPGWHLAINGETVGPMAEDEVRQRYSAGEIDKETAVWQEGFDDWLPLGDVSAFSDLPERGGDDPFAASANQDDYAAPTGAAAAAAGGVAAAAAVAATGTDGGGAAEPQSPRVSKLTGQRNENSVLFSLDSLQAMATAKPAAAAATATPAVARAAANPSKGLSTSAPSSEGSGLIDIKALGSMVGGGGGAAAAASAAPQAAADDAALPSFGGGGFGGLSATPLVSSPAPDAAAAATPVAPAPAPRSNAPIYIMMVVLLLAIGGLAFYIITQDKEPTIVEKEVPVITPQVAADDDDDDKDKKDDKDEKDDKAPAEGESEGDSEGDSEGEEPSGTKTGRSGSGKRRGGGGKKPGGGGGGGGTQSSDPPKSGGGGGGGGGGGSPSVDCILDPSKCKKSGGGKSGGGGGSKPAGGSTDPSAPEKLSTSDIKAGIAPIKPTAKSCGGKHGAKPGEKVSIKFSVSGGSGSVSKATPMAPHAGTALGSCVAGAAKKAKFKKFKKSTMGFQFKFTM